jgi:dihydrodipicolinate synthase/N-acetylneuraminate lyase
MMVLNNMVACPTIYRNNKIDFHEQVALLRYLGLYFDEIIIFGSTGDQMAISVEEKIKFIEYLELEVNLGFKKIYGVSGNNMDEVLKLVTYINKYTECPFIMLMSVPYISLSQKELFDYVDQVNRSYFGKIILYNNYKRTGNMYEIETINRLFRGNYIVCLKDATGFDPKLIDGPVFSGFDIDFFDVDYDGVTSVLGCIMPNTISELVDKRDGFKHKNELIEVIKCLNGIGFVKSIKYILSLKGNTISYETKSPMQKTSLNEMLVLYELYTKRVNVLETIYDQKIQFKIR